MLQRHKRARCTVYMDQQIAYKQCPYSFLIFLPTVGVGSVPSSLGHGVPKHPTLVVRNHIGRGPREDVEREREDPQSPLLEVRGLRTTSTLWFVTCVCVIHIISSGCAFR